MEAVIIVAVGVFVVALIISSLGEETRQQNRRMRAYFAQQNARREAEEAAAAYQEARMQREEERRRVDRDQRLNQMLALLEKNSDILKNYPLERHRSILENPVQIGMTYDADGRMKPIGS